MAVTLNANSSTGFIATSDTSSILQLQTGGTTAISIDASQNVNFAGTAQRITGDFSNATTANRVMFQTSTVNTNTTFGIMPNGTGTNANFGSYGNASDLANTSVLFMGVTNSGTESRFNSAISGTGTYLPMTFFTGGTESLRLSATTKAVILAGGSTSANGTGITFPATQSASSDANTLDDYEEGTWTATITTTGGSVTIGSQTCTYTKVGRLVVLNGVITLSAISSPTGQFTITNLPFVPGTNGTGGATCFLQNIASTPATALFAELSTTPRIYIAKSTTLNSSSDSADLLTATTLIKFGASYSV